MDANISSDAYDHQTLNAKLLTVFSYLNKFFDIDKVYGSKDNRENNSTHANHDLTRQITK